MRTLGDKKFSDTVEGRMQISQISVVSIWWIIIMWDRKAVRFVSGHILHS